MTYRIDRTAGRITRRRCLLVTLTFAALPLGDAALAQTPPPPREVVVTATRIADELPAASTTIIDADEIEHSPARTLPDLIGTAAGIQGRDLFGGTAGARATLDIRGFGAPGKENTLFLLNGRRLNDIDLAAIDFASIPRDSIERIEITRGNVGGVLYGDGAVGGVVNIITRPAAELAPSYGADVAGGSFHYREGNLRTAQVAGPYGLSAYGTIIDSDGYRDNNRLNQRNLVAELRRTGRAGEGFVRLNADAQVLGLPGARRVTLTSSQLDTESDRRAATTPLDKAWQSGIDSSAGITHRFANGVELIVDGGYRIKDQRSTIVDNSGGGFNQYINTTLATWSLTPRVRASRTVAGLPVRTTAGIDLYYSDYNSDRKRNPDEAAIHRYDGNQFAAAAYAQTTTGLGARTELQAGLRFQRIAFQAGDRFDAGAPGAFGVAKNAVSDTATVYALNLGVDHRLTPDIDLFARVARSVRVPTVDERIGTEDSTSFTLLTQTSKDAELGTRLRFGRAEWTTSAFIMDTRHEIRFNPDLNGGFGANANTDPIRRIGLETSLRTPLLANLFLKLNASAIQARFRGGPFDGKDVPLVSNYTARAALSWRVWREITVDALFTYAGEKRMENDEDNTFPRIPSYGLVDLAVRGDHGPFYWSAAVNNLFDDTYYTYAVSSTTTFGTFNAYPLPGRTVLVRGGIRF